MAKHIGIVDVTTLGTTICQLALCRGLKSNPSEADQPEYSAHSLPFSLYQQAHQSDGWDWALVSDLVLRSIAALQRAGADFIIIPNNTAHHAIDLISQQSPLPVLNMVEIVAQHCIDQSYLKIAILGTEATMSGELYDAALQLGNINVTIPEQAIRLALDDMIMNELVLQQLKPGSVANIAEKLKSIQCDAFVLACTELPSVFNHANLAKPCVDTTELLARAALAYANADA
jgi:aspartate racemase